MERRTFTFEQQSAQLDFIVQENEFLMWYDTIIIIKVDQKLSDLFQGTHSQTFNKVKKSLWPSLLLKLKACFFRQVNVGPSQPVAAKVTVLYVAVHLNLRSVISWVNPFPSRLKNKTASFPRKVSHFAECHMSLWTARKKGKKVADEGEIKSPSFDRFPFYYATLFLILQPLGSGYE